jgi:hypothetical protein
MDVWLSTCSHLTQNGDWRQLDSIIGHYVFKGLVADNIIMPPASAEIADINMCMTIMPLTCQHQTTTMEMVAAVAGRLSTIEVLRDSYQLKGTCIAALPISYACDVIKAMYSYRHRRHPVPPDVVTTTQ